MFMWVYILNVSQVAQLTHWNISLSREATSLFLFENGETEDDIQQYIIITIADELRDCIARLKERGITLKQIGAELEYRNRAGDGDGNLHGWDDALCEFTEIELEFIVDNY